MPENQGSLDALCGVYAVINAICLVYPLKKISRRYLFHHLIEALLRDKYLESALLYGTYKRHITLMLREATRYMAERYDVEIIVQPLFESNIGTQLETYFQTLDVFLKPRNRAVIINLRGRLYHWSVARKLSAISILLEDSYGYTHVRKRSCLIGSPVSCKGHYLIPRQTWGLSINE